MSLTVPEKGWFKAPTGSERLWIGLALAWCMVLTLMMPFWHLRGKQNSTGEAYRVKPADFAARVARFVDANKVGELAGITVVAPAPGTDIYLQAQMWRWYPVLKLKKDQTYRLHVSSLDLQHSLSLQPMNMNFQILPGYDHVLTVTPTMAGEYSIICNEFCGIGHHMMVGRIIVEE
ncbi:MAG: cytochrome c oxidase subunit II [Deltaproteobacteria bacterium]|nr:cytochrome c oxidase subunit II [Deltaproteobacteria bacterium]